MFYILLSEPISHTIISKMQDRHILKILTDRKVVMEMETDTGSVWHLRPKEAPKADMIISRLSEAGICLLSGEKENLVSIPVDFNTNNMLPTNMACISKSIASEILHTFKYKVRLESKGIEIVLNTPECFVNYNTAILNAIEMELPEANGKNFVDIYEIIMSRHVKGVDKIKFPKFDRCIEWIHLQRYWFSQVDKLKNKKANIIIGNFGN